MSADKAIRLNPRSCSRNLVEGIGLAFDVPGNRMFMVDLGGSLYTASLDGATHKTLLGVQGNLTWRRLRRLICSSRRISHSRSG